LCLFPIISPPVSARAVVHRNPCACDGVVARNLRCGRRSGIHLHLIRAPGEEVLGDRNPAGLKDFLHAHAVVGEGPGFIIRSKQKQGEGVLRISYFFEAI